MNYDFNVQQANPMQGINNALQTYGNFRDMQLKEEQIGLQRQEYQRAEQERAAQIEKGRRYQESLDDLSDNPSTANILRHSALFPEAYKSNESLMKMGTDEEQRALTQKANNLFMLYESGDESGALNYVNAQLEAAKNTGDQEQIDFWTIGSEMATQDPNSMKLFSGQLLMATEEGRNVVKSLDDSANTKSEIDFREFDKNIKRQEIAFKVEQSKFNNAKEGRQKELHAANMEEHKRKLEDATREKKAGLSNAAASIDNMINTADKALSFPDGVFDDVLGTVDSRFFTFGEEEANLEKTIELLTNQAFMAQIPSMTGLGALSDAEGKKLANSLQSLTLTQGTKEMKESLREIQRLLAKSRKTLYEKHGIKETIPDTPYALKTLDDVTLTPESSVDIGALLDKELGLSQ